MAQPSTTPSVQQQTNGAPSPVEASVAAAAASSSPAPGVPGTPGTPESLHSSVPVKRKRSEGDHEEGDVDMKMDVDADADVEADADVDDRSHLKGMKDPHTLIEDVYGVLASWDVTPSVLKRPLREPDSDSDSDDEPDAKRQKSADDSDAPTIARKLAQDQYALLDDLAIDVVAAARAQVAEQRSAKIEDAPNKEKIMEDTVRFKDKALALFRREMIYPQSAFDPQQRMGSGVGEENGANTGTAILTIQSGAPYYKQLFSSLPTPTSDTEDQDAAVRLPSDMNLPFGISTTRLVSSRQGGRAQTIGELFGPARPTPALQFPRQTRTQAKGNVVGFYHPELTEKSKYRANTYFSSKLSIGHYLDYGNATPASPNKSDKQRERAQSLAGRKPSASELEVSEMESLFRNAFSSFAPTKDDSSVVVPASAAARIYWRQAGQRNYDRMMDAEQSENGVSEQTKSSSAPTAELEELDEKLIEDEIKNFDPDKLDPALWGDAENVKSAEEKEADELLDEVSDLIETLASHQRIRNTSLPSSQNRYATDPGSGDILTNGALAVPSEEETATYEMLKSQLALIVKTLPPYAVARLNGDQLDELLVSTKLEVRTDSTRGVLEERSGGQARARQQQAAPAAANAGRPGSHRTPSASYGAGTQYGGSQYGTPTRQPAAAQQTYYRSNHTPQQQQPYNAPRPGSSQTPYQQQYRPSPTTQAPPRPTNGYAGYASQLAKTQTPFGHQQLQYGQQRPQAYGYGTQPQHNAATPRYSAYGQSYQHHQQQPQQQQHQPGTPSTGYNAYPNGAGGYQRPRTMSPQVQGGQHYSPSPPLPQQSAPPQGQYHQQQQQQQQQQQRSQYPSQSYQQQQRPYGTPQQGMSGSPVNRPAYPNGTPQQQQTNHYSQGVGGPVQNSQEASRLAEQARARIAAQQAAGGGAGSGAQSQPQGQSQAQGGNFSATQYAATQKPQSPANSHLNPSSRPPSTGPNGSTGTGTPIPRKVTPVPVPNVPGAPTPAAQQGQGQGRQGSVAGQGQGQGQAGQQQQQQQGQA